MKINPAALTAGLLLAGAAIASSVWAENVEKANVTVRATLSPLTKPASQVVETQIIVLQHVLPAQLLKSLHWDKPANLPTGVTQIQAASAQNALSVTATSVGLAKVQEIIKLRDIEPRQVRIQSAIAHASNADIKAAGIEFELAPMNQPHSTPIFVQCASGSPAVRFLQTLTQHGVVIETPQVTTTNLVTASINISTTLPSGKVMSQQFAVTPRVNSDNSVTLALHPVFLDGPVKREFNTIRTVKSGETMIIVMPPAATQVTGENLLFFVTPTIK